jgi:hypothetical protein
MKSALLSLILFIAPLFGASAAEVIKVPFNFQWGESSERLEDGMAKVKARIVERRNVQNRKCIVVEGIPQRLLIRALFYFDSDALNEIELQYGDPSWDSSEFTNFFDQTRRNIESKYGPGRMIAQQKSWTAPPSRDFSATSGSNSPLRSPSSTSPPSAGRRRSGC